MHRLDYAIEHNWSWTSSAGAACTSATTACPILCVLELSDPVVSGIASASSVASDASSSSPLVLDALEEEDDEKVGSARSTWSPRKLCNEMRPEVGLPLLPPVVAINPVIVADPIDPFAFADPNFHADPGLWVNRSQ